MIELKTFKTKEGTEIWIGEKPVIVGLSGFRIFIHDDDKLTSESLIAILEGIKNHLNKWRNE